MLEGIADATDNGSPLSDALDGHPRFFPAAYRALVRAGERSGNLARVAGRLKELALLRRSAARRAAAYLLYPVLLVAVLGMTAAVIVITVLPQFTKMFGEFGAETPGALAFVERAAGALVRYWYLFPLVPCAVWFAWRSVALARARSFASPRLGWHLPFLKRYERRRAVSQYALVAGRLMEAGVPEQEALEVAAASSGNACMDGITARAAARVAEGQKLSDALRAADARGELPPEFAWYVEVGEASGRLPEALLSASEAAAERSRSALSSSVSLIVPASVVAGALVVGTLGYAVFEALVTMMELA